MITAVVMVGENSDGHHAGPESPNPVAWVQDARRAAAADLVTQLSRLDLLERLILVSPDPLGTSESIRTPDNFHLDYWKSPPGPVHVGQYLTDITNRFQVNRLLYFGGGSAPLLSDVALRELTDQLAHLEIGAITNNKYASDWVGVTPASILSEWTPRLPHDNMLGWVLSSEAGLPVKSLPPTAANRLDIDTPSDLLTLRLHPDTGPHLAQFLAQLPLDTSHLAAAMAILATPASHVFISGRLSPAPWHRLNMATQCWLRVFSEERGMVSSGRLERGEVYSLLADHIELIGLAAFFTTLAQQVQVAFIDTRVLLAHRGSWPSENDRYASDLGLVDQIKDPWLRDFTTAALEAPIPVILGGHGLLAGDLLALCDLL